MSNKVVYSCDMSDEGSDMDVSDNEDYINITRSHIAPQQVNTIPKPTIKPLPHQGMVTSLHRFMQRDSWGANAIKPMAEKKLKHKPVPQNNNSYASVVTGRKRSFNPDEEDDCLSDDSFHTAPSSPQPIVIDDFEPGQIADPPTQDELVVKIKELETKLKGHAELEERIKENLNSIRARKEELRIRRLQREVRLSIAKNRKPKSKSKSNNKSKSVSSRILQEVDEEESSAKEVTPPPLSKHAKKVLREEAAKKRKSKKRLRSPPAEGVNEYAPDLNIDSPVVEVNEDTPNLNISSPAAEDQDEVELPEEDEEEEMEIEDDDEEDDDDDDEEDDDDIEQVEERSPVGRPLNFRQQKIMTKRLKRLEHWEKRLSPEEQELIKPDGPAYQSIDKVKSKHLAKMDRKRVEAYFATQTISMKQMRLMLLNMKQASMERQLTFTQEQFLIVLAKLLLQYIEAYETLDEPYYTEALNKKPESISPHVPLDPEFYGDWNTLNLEDDDVNYYEIYKCIRHFEAIVNGPVMKKARQFLLKTGENVQRSSRLRSSNPEENVPSVIAIQNDPTLCKRVAQYFNSLKKERQREFAALRKAKRMMNLSNRPNQPNKNKRRKTNVPKPNPINSRVGRPKFDKARAIENQALKAEVSKMNFDITYKDSAPNSVSFKRAKHIKPEAVKPIPMSTSESLAMDNENDRLEKEINYMAKKISAQIHKSKKPKTSHTPDSPVDFVGTQIPTQLPQVEAMSIDNDAPKNNTSIFKKSNNVKAHQPANARPLLNSNPQQARPNQNTDFSPIEIIDNDMPQAAASPQTKNHARNTMPAPTQTTPVTSGPNNSNSSHYVPYRSALSALGLGATSSTTSAPAAPQPVVHKSAALCSAESSGGVCNDKSCRFTHFKDFI